MRQAELLTAPQPSLFDLRPIVEVQHDPDESLDSRFRHWIAANPHVLEAFIGFALQLRRAGRKHFGAKAIVERLRWEYAVRPSCYVDEDDDGRQIVTLVDDVDFVWNNNYTSRLARLAAQRCPELAGMFEFRELRS